MKALASARRAAQAAGLHYVHDRMPGITRRRKGKTFQYFDPKGRKIRGHNAVLRIRRLAIPPAWKDVWICPAENGHLQATGKDIRGRKQYRYHEEWRKQRDETKYENVLSFGRALPKIRRRVSRDLARPGLPREKVLATVIRLLETTLIRVGNEEYVRENHSYGLTTMRNRHARVRGAKIRFSFRGKSGKQHAISVESPRLAAIVKRCRHLPGHELFGYRDASGAPVDITSGDVNAYLQEITGQPFTAKDFRTWAGTVLAARALQEFKKFTSQVEGRRNLLKAIGAVARVLGNTPAICRKSYIHPVILDSYLSSGMIGALRPPSPRASKASRLRPEESAVLDLLRRKR